MGGRTATAGFSPRGSLTCVFCVFCVCVYTSPWILSTFLFFLSICTYSLWKQPLNGLHLNCLYDVILETKEIYCLLSVQAKLTDFTDTFISFHFSLPNTQKVCLRKLKLKVIKIIYHREQVRSFDVNSANESLHVLMLLFRSWIGDIRIIMNYLLYCICDALK